MDYTCRNTIIQNMQDFGSNQETIDLFLKYFDQGDIVGQKKVIECYRKKLLEELHEKQKEIDLLDYMVYQLSKCNCSENKEVKYE